MLEQWTAVDDYFDARLTPDDDVLAAALEASAAAGLLPHHVPANQGMMLHLLARMMNARAILEIGTLGAYSTIWLARGLAPGGSLITLEADPRYADVARANLERAGCAGRVEVRVGPALETLPMLEAEGRTPFDLIFIDADKPNNPAYMASSLRMSRPGTVIVIDNVVRDGAVLDTEGDDPNVRGVRAVVDMIAADSRLGATAIQTVGAKGYDGFLMAMVIGDATPGS